MCLTSLCTVVLWGPRLGDKRVRLYISRPSYGVGVTVRHFYPWGPLLFLGAGGGGDGSIKGFI